MNVSLWTEIRHLVDFENSPRWGFNSEFTVTSTQWFAAIARATSDMPSFLPCQPLGSTHGQDLHAVDQVSRAVDSAHL